MLLIQLTNSKKKKHFTWQNVSHLRTRSAKSKALISRLRPIKKFKQKKISKEHTEFDNWSLIQTYSGACTREFILLRWRRKEEQEGKLKMALHKSFVNNHHFFLLVLLSFTSFACLRSQAQSLPKQEGNSPL